MAMSQSMLSTQLQNMVPVNNEPAAITNFVNAWKTYFAASAAGAASYVSSPAHASAMSAAMVGMSAPGAGAAKIQAGIIAWWASVVATGPATYPGSTVVVAPTLITGIAALLTPVFASNTSGSLSLAAACNAIAAVLHVNNLGGTATIATVVTPIV